MSTAAETPRELSAGDYAARMAVAVEQALEAGPDGVVGVAVTETGVRRLNNTDRRVCVVGQRWA